LSSNAIKRIGVYGGTFDPIHTTHLDIARTALRHAHLDRVLFIVAARPPHKQGEVFAEAQDRLELVRAALADEPAMEASRLELDRSGYSFTVDTLDLLQQQYPGAALYLILGYDSLVELPGWRDPEGIFARAHILAAPRPGVLAPVPPMLAGHYDLLPFQEREVSSTDIRARIAAGEEVRAWLPPAVERLIRQKGLYHAAP